MDDSCISNRVCSKSVKWSSPPAFRRYETVCINSIDTRYQALIRWGKTLIFQSA